MSQTSAELIAKLPAEVQAFVQNASSHLVGNAAFGGSGDDSKEIADWLTAASDFKGKEQLSVRSASLDPPPSSRNLGSGMEVLRI